MNDEMIKRLTAAMDQAHNSWHGSYASDEEITKDFLSALTPADFEALLPEGWVIVGARSGDDGTSREFQVDVDDVEVGL